MPNFRRATSFIFAASLMLSTQQIQAHEFYAKSFTIIHPWTMPAAAGDNAAVYLRCEEVSAGDKLIAAHSSIAKSIELRAVHGEGTTASSELLREIEIPVGPRFDLQARGLYLYMRKLTTPLLWERSYPMTLVFEKAGPVEVVLSLGAHD